MQYIYKAGVVGAGQMGAGIAQVISFAGIPVVLRDVSQAALDRGMGAIREIYEQRVRKGRMSAEEVESKLSLVTPSVKDDDLREVDIVVEAVFEDLRVKSDLFARLHQVCSPGCLFATNTSSLSISAMARASGRPDRVVGMHFFYPANVMKLVEVVPALQTSAETVDAVVSFAESLRKIPVKVKECPGFLVNRLLAPYLNEAVRCFSEGAASMEVIDGALVQFGMPMGPFLLLDSVGIDIALHVSRVLAEGFGPRAGAPDLLESLVSQGRLGRKSGAGFYLYDGRADDGVLARRVRRAPGSEFSVERVLLSMLNEACACLEEGVASASDVDLALMAGIGFPQAAGGLLHWADTVGLDKIEASLRQLSGRYGERFWPHLYLQRLVHAGFAGRGASHGFFEYA
ncbi:MAG TPA: 3-hydroxyacyl-CoA dehydrogenase [Planctomycetota bacterium]|nr:3-hydroxyacyl-CoA dehydrogenase [Planctomycetota bacterium]